MNNLQVFNNEQFGKVRAVDVNGKPFVVASDVAKALGYKRANDAISQHCRYTVKHSIPHPQNNSKNIDVNLIPEGDIYRLIIKAKLPAAAKFESWVMDTVLPSIRQNGSYVSDNITDKQAEALQMYSTKQFIKKTFETTGVELLEERYKECMNYNSNKKTAYKLEIMNLILDTVKQRKEIAEESNKIPLVAMLQEIIINIGEDIKQKSLRSKSGRIGAKTKIINKLESENKLLEDRISRANAYLDYIEPRPEEYQVLDLHGFSVNSMYVADVTEYGTVRNDFNGKPRLKRTASYNIFSKNFRKAIKQIDPKLDPDKHYNIFLYFDHISGYDSHNLHKSFFDSLANYCNINDQKLHLMRCDTNKIISNYKEGKIYFVIRERQ